MSSLDHIECAAELAIQSSVMPVNSVSSDLIGQNLVTVHQKGVQLLTFALDHLHPLASKVFEHHRNRMHH